MQRVPEPELMDDADQARAYAAADFTAGDQQTIALIRALVSKTATGASPSRVIDLGCGPGNITLRDGQQTPPPCPQARSAEDRQTDKGRAEAG